jgi:hypothetical protein
LWRHIVGVASHDLPLPVAPHPDLRKSPVDGFSSIFANCIARRHDGLTANHNHGVSVLLEIVVSAVIAVVLDDVPSNSLNDLWLVDELIEWVGDDKVSRKELVNKSNILT